MRRTKDCDNSEAQLALVGVVDTLKNIRIIRETG